MFYIYIHLTQQAILKMKLFLPMCRGPQIVVGIPGCDCKFIA